MPETEQERSVTVKGGKTVVAPQTGPTKGGDSLGDSLNDKLSDPLAGPKAKKTDDGLAAATRPLDQTGDAAKWKTGKVETQSSKHMFILYEQAAVALVGLGSETERVASATNGTPKVCPELKGRKRAMEKVEADYGGHPERLLDLARASIIYEDDASLKKGVDLVNGSMDVVREKNNFENPMGGYRDYNFNIRIDGHICELQLHLAKIIEAKAEGHKDYEVVRGIEARMKKGEPLSDKDLAVMAEKKSEMWKLYNDAYAASGGKVTDEQRAKEPKKKAS